jgi:drug/metabolite transporter (DMT)-like permease
MRVLGPATPSWQVRLLPVLALSLSTAVWGSSFFLSKRVVDQHDPMTLVALRFGIGTALMLAVRPRCLRALDRTSWLHATACGAVYGAAQLPHYYGLRDVPASTAGFLVGVYVVVTPVLDYVLFRRRSTRRTLLGVGLAAVGLAVLAWSGGGSVTGFALCLVAAAVYALQISVLGAWAPARDAWAFTLVQLGTVAVLVGTAATVKGFDPPTSGGDWLVVVYLAVVVGVLGIGVQTWAQHRIPATHAAVVMSGEPLWAAVLAVALTAEVLTARLVVGGALLVVANVVIALSHRGAPAGSAAARSDEHGNEQEDRQHDDPDAERRRGPAVLAARRRAHRDPEGERSGDREARQ